MQFRTCRVRRSQLRFPPAPILLVLAIVLAGICPIATTDAAGFAGPAGNLLATPAVKLERRPPTPWLMAGESVTYAIHATPVGIGTAAAEISLNYGRDLQLVDVKPGPYLGEHTIPGPKIINADQRQATYAWARVGPTPNPSQPGVLAYVTFRAVPGNPWNTWVRQQVSLVDGHFKASQNYDSAFHLQVYDRLPVPIGILPGAPTSSAGTATGPHPVFGVRTPSPGSFKYRIEVSQDSFESTLHTFDQSASQSGWNDPVYRGNALAEFVSPKALKPGKYQWRAYAFIEEVNQWTAPSRVQEFEVRTEAMGLSSLSPRTIAQFPGGRARVAVQGWGFTSGTGASLAIAGIGTTHLEVESASDSRIVVSVPESIDPGLAELNLLREDGQVRTSPLLILPPALFTTRTDLPKAQQVVPGQEFPVHVAFSNSGSDQDSIALVAVDLPDSQLFELVSIEGRDSVEVLDQDLDLVLLTARDGSSVRFKFRLPSELVGSRGPVADQTVPMGAALDFGFKPTVLGEVSSIRWEQLQSNPVARRVQEVQEETARRLQLISRSFNRAPPALLEEQIAGLPVDSQSSSGLELITRLQGNGLEMSRIFSAFLPVSRNQLSRLFREYRYFAGVWP